MARAPRARTKKGSKGKGKDVKGTSAVQCYRCGKYVRMEKDVRLRLSGNARTFTKGGTGKDKGGNNDKNDKNVNAVAAEADKRVECLECLQGADESSMFMTYKEPNVEHWTCL